MGKLRSLSERVGDKVEVDPVSGCWNWTGCKDAGGYGRISVDNAGVVAHRVSYELHVGPIPDGLELDHLCRNRGCVNPEHLEPVTAQENMKRAKALIVECPHGHPYDERNTLIERRRNSVARVCRTCKRERARQYEQKR